jgi:hypothetical protein
MTAAAGTDWRQEFGLSDRAPPRFFARKEDIDAAGSAAPQPHALRRAFQLLELDGVLCQETTPAVSTPTIYFRQVERIEPAAVVGLHRLFWNQGVAPLLVLIARDQVHVYSGLTPPGTAVGEGAQAPGFVERLNRVTEELRAFIVAVESGEYFHARRKSFDPRQRVDRALLRNLQAAREELDQVPAARLSPQTLDALLCRLVFTCYLFDRKVIDKGYLEPLGIREAEHLRDILGRRPRPAAKDELYTLFGQLGRDFNGDLFSDDLDAEARQVKADHIDILDRFFRATEVRTGQGAFWPYHFGMIPIETISAIYEHFLKAAGEEEKKQAGAFYTPRVLAELLLDIALDGAPTLLDKRFLDPSCGSGIFLVGLFNRMAEEWRRHSPNATYLQQVKGLLKILRENIRGVDKNETACKITAFSLYLAFLDQLRPPDIRELQRKGKVLPRLLYSPDQPDVENQGGTIRCADFFTPQADIPEKVHFVVGNPPWASVKSRNAPAARWCEERSLPFPDRQLATAFVWKAPSHLEEGGKACFVLPHGTLFNHSPVAIDFQQEWFRRHAVERVLNLADYQRFLFEESEAPALIVRYRKERPTDTGHAIDYWAPKSDWSATQAEMITILPQDRWRLTVGEVLSDLKGDDAPLIWKERFWATPRDWRLLDRLSLLPRLRDIVGQGTRREGKRWLIAEGFQPLGENDDPAKGKTLTLPSRRFIKATSPALSLFLLKDECQELPSREVVVRSRSNKNVQVFRAPHVLVTKGLSRSAFADFDVAFRHALRGIHGPREDRDMLLFLAAYLQTRLARFFLFHTSSNWGVSRQEVHVEELLRLPFPLPDQAHDPKRCRGLVRDVARIVTEAAGRAGEHFTDRKGIVSQAQAEAEKLVEEYFDIDGIERALIGDTENVIIPSFRPTRAYPDVPAVHPSTEAQRAAYTKLLCDTLNGWAKKEYQVHGKAGTAGAAGVGLVVLEKTRRGEPPAQINGMTDDVLTTLAHLERIVAKRHSSFELVRGLKVFDKNLLYITKPLGQRFWTSTAALNDADEVAGTILMRSAREGT